jgi:hypothetical protein
MADTIREITSQSRVMSGHATLAEERLVRIAGFLRGRQDEADPDVRERAPQDISAENIKARARVDRQAGQRDLRMSRSEMAGAEKVHW